MLSEETFLRGRQGVLWVEFFHKRYGQNAIYLQFLGENEL